MTSPRTHNVQVWPYLLIGIVTLIGLGGGVGLWMLRAVISSAVVAPGVLTFADARHVMQHPMGGVIAHVHVREADVVSAGDLLIEFDATRQRKERAAAQAHLFELRAMQVLQQAQMTFLRDVPFDPALLQAAGQRDAYRLILARQVELHRARYNSMLGRVQAAAQQKVQLAARIAGTKVQLGAMSTQLSLVEIALENQRALFKRGLTQAAAVLQLEREQAQLQGQLGALRGQMAEAREQSKQATLTIVQHRDDYRAQAAGAAAEADQQIRQIEVDIARLAQEIAQATVTAPVPGVVHDVRFQTRHAVVRPAEPIMTLLPRGQALTVTAEVTPDQIDAVQVGQTVKMRLSALNQRITPEVAGTVLRVSADRLEVERTGRAYFAVDISLPPEERRKLPKGVALLPGMPVQAFIQTGEWSPLAYLIKPLRDYFAQALRES